MKHVKLLPLERIIVLKRIFSVEYDTLMYVLCIYVQLIPNVRIRTRTRTGYCTAFMFVFTTLLTDVNHVIPHSPPLPA